MKNRVYQLTEEINGQNLVIPNDCDFESGTILRVTRVAKDSVECVEVGEDGLSLALENNRWAFNRVEFEMCIKKL